MSRATRVRRVNRRELPGIYLALLVYGIVGYTMPLAAAGPPPVAPVPVTAAVPVVAVRAAVLTDVATAPGDRVVALTFDDGPDPVWTPKVLDLLARHDAVATFCMVGSRAVEHPDLVRAVARAGMRLCDHTRSHDEQLATRPPALIASEILGARADLWAAADVRVGYFRAPAGNWGPNLAQTAAANGMQPLGWSVDPRDWTEPGTAAIVANVQRHVHPGAVILLHDGGARRGQTLAALEELLPWLTAQGYRFGFPT